MGGGQDQPDQAVVPDRRGTVEEAIGHLVAPEVVEGVVDRLVEGDDAGAGPFGEAQAGQASHQAACWRCSLVSLANQGSAVTPRRRAGAMTAIDGSSRATNLESCWVS